MSAIGTGIEWNGAYKEAVVYFEKASALAKQHPDSGYPFLTVAGEVETLVKEREFDSAESLINQASTVAVEHRKLIKITQLMLFDADIAIGQQQLDKAIEILRKTIPIAEHNRTNMLADAQMKLAKIYRQQHKLVLAEQYATQAFSHTELTKNLFTAPARLEFAAQLQWDLGRRSQARRSIARALDISGGLLAQTSSGAVREGLEAFSTSVLLAADFEQRFTDALTGLKSAAGRRDDAGSELDRLTFELAAVPRDPVLAGLVPEIDRWKDLSGKILAARNDCPKREAEWKRLSATREALCEQLGVSVEDTPRLRVEQRKRIELLAGKKLVLEAKQVELPSKISSFELGLEEMEHLFSSLPPEVDTTELAEQLAQVRAKKQPDIEAKRLRTEPGPGKTQTGGCARGGRAAGGYLGRTPE